MTKIADRVPLSQIVEPRDRARVAEARRRVALKRWLRNNNCSMPDETPTHIMRTMTQRIKAGHILIVP